MDQFLSKMVLQHQNFYSCSSRVRYCLCKICRCISRSVWYEIQFGSEGCLGLCADYSPSCLIRLGVKSRSERESEGQDEEHGGWAPLIFLSCFPIPPSSNTLLQSRCSCLCYEIPCHRISSECVTLLVPCYSQVP